MHWRSLKCLFCPMNLRFEALDLAPGFQWLHLKATLWMGASSGRAGMGEPWGTQKTHRLKSSLKNLQVYNLYNLTRNVLTSVRMPNQVSRISPTFIDIHCIPLPTILEGKIHKSQSLDIFWCPAGGRGFWPLVFPPAIRMAPVDMPGFGGRCSPCQQPPLFCKWCGRCGRLGRCGWLQPCSEDPDFRI